MKILRTIFVAVALLLITPSISLAATLTTFATLQTGSGPAAMAFDTAGNLYTANSSNKTISKISPSGVVTTFATFPDSLNAIAFDTAGNLYTANYTGGSFTPSGHINKITPSGTISNFATLPISSWPYSLAFDTVGNLYVTNGISGPAPYYRSTNGTISKITPSGAVSTFATICVMPGNLAFDTAGNLYTACNNDYANTYALGTISKVTPSGTVSTFATLGAQGYGTPKLAFDTAGNLYTANWGAASVNKITPSGTVTNLAGSYYYPSALAFDTESNLYVANYGGSTITKVTPSGTATTFVYLGGVDSPYALAFDTAGNLYTANYSSNTVKKISSSISVSSNISSSWTITGPATITGSGTTQTTTSKPTGTYTITWGAVAGYTTPVSQSLTLASMGTISFSGNYVALAVPTVTTPTVASVTTSGATLGADVTSLGNPATITARGTCWGTTASPITNCVAETGTTTGVFTHARTGLTASTLYYYRGYATNSTGTGYSADGTFTTLAALAVPTVTTPTIASITTSSATLGAEVTSLGNPATITARGTCWGVAASPTTYCVAATGVTTGIFTHTRTGMTANNIYFYRGYADNSTGRGYSASGSFMTLAVPTVTTPTAASITTSGATLGASVTSLGNPATITARGTCWGTTASPTTNCVAEGGTTTGIFIHARASMAAGTLYYYRGYADNSAGRGYSTDGMFKTGEVPTVTTPTVASITSNGATLGANVTSIGSIISAKTDYITGSYPYNLTISPDGTSVYVVNRTSNTVSMFARNTTTGTLSVKTDYVTGAYPNSVTVSSDGKSVYVANYTGNTVSMFARNTTTGTLSVKTDYATGAAPASVTISPDGTSVYVVNRNSNTVSMFPRNTTTGALSAKTDYTTGTSPWSVAVSSDGNSVYTANLGSNTVSMFTRNTTTGTLSVKTDYATGASPTGVSVSSDGTSVYVTNQNSNTVSMFTRNTTTGTLSVKTDYATGSGPNFIAISTDGTSLYVTNYASNTVSMFTRNTTTGTLSVKTDYPTGVYPIGVTISPDSKSVYVVNYVGNTVSMFDHNTTIARGTCWGTTASPTINCVAEGGTTTGIFTHLRASMTASTLYYYRGYADNSTGRGYSADGTFTTLVNSYTVSATAGAGGTISPASNTVSHGSTTTFTVTPNTGYTASASGCAGALSGTTYTTGAITGACTVSATFTLNSYTVSATAGSGGTISPASNTVSHGSTTTFTVTPNTGYTASASGCAGALSGTTYTTGAITGACTVSATFTLNSYTVSATAGSGGTISPASNTVSHGSTTTFTVTPNTWYAASVTGCGGSLSGITYTTGAITGACTVSVTFTSLNTSTSPTISISPTTYYSGVSNTYTFSATDTQGDQVRYGIDWNMDGSVDDWLPAFPGYVNSGTSRSMSYTWSTTGNKQFQALTQDYQGINSAWTTYTITVVAPLATPTVTTPTVTSIIPTGATLGSNVTSLGNPATITARGTCWGTTPAPLINCAAQGGLTTGIFTHTRASMTANTPYYYRGYATNSTGTGYSTDGTFTTTAVPTVTTPTVASITPTGATLGADVTSLGNPATITARGTCWGTTASPITNCVAEGGTTNGVFTHARTSMLSNTLYYYRGYADNSTGRGYSVDGTFTTNDIPAVTTISGPTTLITGISGTYSFVSTDPQGEQISYAVDWNSDGTDLWMPYGSVPPPGGMTYVDSGVSQSASKSWSTPGTYTLRVLAQDTMGNNSAWTTYTITVADPLAVPTVTTPTAASITTSGATLGASVTSLGNPATITARGTCWGTTASPITNCVAATGVTTGIFTHARTGLTANTLYYYRGYSDNSTGRGYSADGSFTTNMETPTSPIISGPTTLRAEQSGTYSFVSTDPQNQQISYAVDWNSDGTDLWMPYGSVPPPGGMTYVNSGVSQSASKSWATPGTYTVRVLAQNKVGGLNSAWAIFNIIVTCANNTINPPTCTQCGDNIAYANGGCVDCSTGGCTGAPGGNSTNSNSTLTCNSGAYNIPTCNVCPGGQTLVGIMCVNNCTNGATNPTTCDACPLGQELLGGICTVITSCGDSTCNGSETLLTCPADCKVKYQQF